MLQGSILFFKTKRNSLCINKDLNESWYVSVPFILIWSLILNNLSLSICVPCPEPAPGITVRSNIWSLWQTGQWVKQTQIPLAVSRGYVDSMHKIFRAQTQKPLKNTGSWVCVCVYEREREREREREYPQMIDNLGETAYNEIYLFVSFSKNC